MSHIVTLSHLLMTRHRYLQGHQSHRVQSYSRDKTDWTVQSWKLSYSRENGADIGLKFPLNKDIDKSIQILWLVVKFEKRFWKQWLMYVLSVCAYFHEKKSLLTDKAGKCHYTVPSTKITPFSNKFTFLMYSMNQYTHSVSRVCTPTAWIFKKQSKSKPEPVHMQWGYCVVYEFLKHHCTIIDLTGD